MVSKAIASLDAWLERAEQVLQERRQSGISPSQSTWKTTDYNNATITVDSFAAALYGLLRDLSNRPGRWVLIAEDAKRPDRFVQFLVFEDGSACAECVSNLYLDPIDQWTSEQEEQLASLGWNHPIEPNRPNWITVEETFTPDFGTVTERTIATLRIVFGLELDDLLLTKLFSSPLRGHTPASARYEEVPDDLSSVQNGLTCEGSAG